jgi:hypothetical protein
VAQVEWLVGGRTIKGSGRLCLTLEGSFTSRMASATGSERERIRVFEIYSSEELIVIPEK